KRVQLLLNVVRDAHQDDAVRAQAVVGLSDRSQELADELIALARGPRPALRDEALRALTGTPLTAPQRQDLEALSGREPTAPLVARVLGQPFVQGRPAADDLDA